MPPGSLFGGFAVAGEQVGDAFAAAGSTSGDVADVEGVCAGAEGGVFAGS